MKRFKKIVSTVLAVLLALSVLTACESAGGSNISLTAQLFGNPSHTLDTWYIESIDGPYQTPKYHTVFTTDGTCTYVTGEGDSAYLIFGDEYYYMINTNTNKAFRFGGKFDDFMLAMPYAEVMEYGEAEYGGKKYKTESITVVRERATETFTYYYENGVMKYILLEDYYDAGGTSIGHNRDMLRVDVAQKSADESKLNINNYTIVDSLNDLGFFG